jgi:hypothetical protein
MFEDYLIDAYEFALEARKANDERTSKRYYRAATFYAISSVEAFINFIGDILSKGGKTAEYEIAFLTDKKFGVVKDSFTITKQVEYNRLDDKLRFLICKYVKEFDFVREPEWSRFIELKRFRDGLVHPRTDIDEINIADYDEKIKTGLYATIRIIDMLCKGFFQKNLRKKIRDLTL